MLLGSCTSSQTENKKQLISEISKTSTINVSNKTFTNRGDLGGHIIEFIDSSRYKTFGWCDICSGSGSYGIYKLVSKKIILQDTLCF